MMATCKDCLHVEACKNLYEIHGDGLSSDSHACKYFKDRARFVELPCKVGDMVYCPRYSQFSEQWEIDEWVVIEISFINYHLGNVFDSNGKWVVGDKENRIAIKLTLSDKSELWIGSIDVPLKDFRDMFFPYREAAEQALKERESNGGL